jgi:hypothetical protein
MEFSIHGRLIVEDCKGHQEMILKELVHFQLEYSLKIKIMQKRNVRN